MASEAFIAGKDAALANKQKSDNPYICGLTKLGNPKFGDMEAGLDWEAGWYSVQPPRQSTKKEMEDARRYDLSQFKRKRNRYYGY